MTRQAVNILKVLMVVFFSFFFFTQSQVAYAYLYSDLNFNNIADSEEVEVVATSSSSLLPGEYFFNSLVINSGAVLKLEGDPDSSGQFKGVKIFVTDLVVQSGGEISASQEGYGPSQGPGATGPINYQAGAGYGGAGSEEVPVYGSATFPKDLGSGGPYTGNGGGAIWIVSSGSIVHNGLISADGSSSSSGGSVLIESNTFSGSGNIRANGGGFSFSSIFFSPGGGGRVAVYYNASNFIGNIEAKGGCGSLGIGYPYVCAGNGTAGLFDKINNNIHISYFWRFQNNDGDFNFNSIFFREGGVVELEPGAHVKANNFFINKGSKVYLIENSSVEISQVDLAESSVLSFGGNNTFKVNHLFINSGSMVTVSSEKVLYLNLKNLNISSGSSVSADGKGYGYGAGPGAPSSPFSGASYGGVGSSNSATSTYGSTETPTDFGSGGYGHIPNGGGAIRIIIEGNFINNGVVSADGTHTSSGGSLYVTADNLSGNGAFHADGGPAYCPNSCLGPGGGGRVALYYGASSFSGEVHASGITSYGGSSTDGTVVFEQMEQGCSVDCFSNVLFIPGLEASRLYTQTGGSEEQLWEPQGNFDVEKLYLNPDGTSVNSGIYTGEIIKETNVPTPTGLAGQNIYKTFSATMNNLVSSQKINQWNAYAYDWRQGVQDIVDNGTKYFGVNKTLTSEIQNLLVTSKNGKVTIIAHSNGGLIAKAFLKKLQDDKTAGRNNLIDHIDVLILVASPQLGTPTAIPAILHGYDQDINLFSLYSFMNKSTARELGRNMPSAYSLLPSIEYFNRVNVPVINFVTNIFDPYISKDIQIYGQNINTYSKQKNFMLGTDGRQNPAITNTLKPIIANSSLFGSAESLHSSIDSLVLPQSIEVIQIAGWGIDTLAGFEYSANKVCSSPTNNGCTGTYLLDEEPVFTVDGDRTVVTPSALAMNGEKWWLNLLAVNRARTLFSLDSNHKNILEVMDVLNFISNKMQNLSGNFSYLSTSTPIDTSGRLRLSVHSPVTFDAYDIYGNHTGKVCPAGSIPCYIEENIPNSGYYEFGEGKYINLPQAVTQKIILQGTDVGTFTFNSTAISPSGQSDTSQFVDIPVTTQTQAEIVLNQVTSIPQLKLDVTGDGITDFTLNPSDSFDPVSYLQIMKVTINSLDLNQNRKDAFSKRVDNIVKSIQKGKIDKAKLRAERFKGVLENKIAKPDPKKPKPKKLSKTDAQLLLDMLNQLLDNLN